jgi:hypothetical protein
MFKISIYFLMYIFLKSYSIYLFILNIYFFEEKQSYYDGVLQTGMETVPLKQEMQNVLKYW